MSAKSPTNAQLTAMARPLFPRYGLQNVGGIVATAVHYRSKPGHVKIDPQTGGWGGWFAAEHATELGKHWITIGFAADHRRTAADARALIERALEDLRYDARIPEEVAS